MNIPGPWAVNKGKQESLTIRAGQQAIAVISGYGVGRRLADAHLIAAAPELLEALKLAVRQNSHDMLMTGEELRQCEAAIAKVEGQQ